LANLLRKRNQLDRAIELLRKAVSLEASASSQESKSKYRGRMRDATPFFNLGTALQAKKSWKESVQALREADRRLPNNAAILAELGASLFGAGNFDEARPVLEKAVERDDKFWKTHELLGEIHLRQGRPGQALDCLGKAVKLAPNEPIIHSNIGVALSAQGKSEKAIKAFQEALQRNPKFAPA